MNVMFALNWHPVLNSLQCSSPKELRLGVLQVGAVHCTGTWHLKYSVVIVLLLCSVVIVLLLCSVVIVLLLCSVVIVILLCSVVIVLLLCSVVIVLLLCSVVIVLLLCSVVIVIVVTDIYIYPGNSTICTLYIHISPPILSLPPALSSKKWLLQLCVCVCVCDVMMMMLSSCGNHFKSIPRPLALLCFLAKPAIFSLLQGV